MRTIKQNRQDHFRNEEWRVVPAIQILKKIKKENHTRTILKIDQGDRI